ncbi:PQQ-dependent sugar dehydrogenase [Aliiglaciecola aliphaticivorans]
MKNIQGLLLLFFAVLYSTSGLSVPLDKLILPDGFKIAVYAEDVTNARQMAMGKNGIIYVGSRSEGKVHAVIDTNQDGKADKVVVVADNLTMPTGIAYKDGDLYVAAVSEVLMYENIDEEYANSPKGEVVISGLPTETHHGWKYIDFGPDGWLYVPVGAPCNICQTVGDGKFDDPRFASILKFNLATKEMKWVAKGVRNTVGFDWHPDSEALWFSDNGRDWMGDDIPPCEINRVTADEQHFGYPYIHGGDIIDPEFGTGKDPDDYTKPELKLGAHVAPLGVQFYQGTQFPAAYKKSLFVAEHGSWNRTEKSGYRVMRANFDGTEIGSYETFIEGFLNPDDTVWGRPVAFLTLPDGSLLISDDFANVIYKVTYQK